MSEQLKDSDYKEYGHFCHNKACWCQPSITILKSKWHGTTISENLYQRIAQLALEHKRSVIKEIEYILEKGLLWLESEDQL